VRLAQRRRVKPDVILIHPPSIYDFRERDLDLGPLSDVIPSSPIFEMYPVGFLTLAAYLRRHGYRVRIINLALLMMRSREFRPEKLLARLRPKLFGIDLHWLPHAHGSIEVARLLKKLHPDIPIVFGGISATYFHEELIREPAVDFVLRGSVTEPSLLALIREIEGEQQFDRVPGLTWKGGVNPDQALACSLDEYTIDLGMMVSDVVGHLDFWSSVPFHRWWQHPITAVFTVRGCRRGCVTCGAPRPVILRSPQAIAAQVRQLAAITRAPIFLVGDLRDAGDEYAHEVLDALARAPVSNRIVFEFFDPPNAEFVTDIDRSISRWGAELSPESHDERIRALLRKARFTNARMESSIEAMMKSRCEKLDLFYMIGLPGQTYRSVMETVDAIDALSKRFGERLGAFITPMGPFIDPGSDGFEHAASHGYILRARTLAEHRTLLESRDWESMLNYETQWMTRHEIVQATRDAYARLRPNAKAALFPPAALLRNFRPWGILRLLAREGMKRLRDARHATAYHESSPHVSAAPNLIA
jgi:B12-binding domain/radical SAM domain protein